MKQKIVIEVKVRCEKCRSKAMEIAADTDVLLRGKYKDTVVVTGDGVDSASLAKGLAKKLGYASLETVEEMEEKPAVDNDETKD